MPGGLDSAARRTNVYTIPPGRPFLDVLARAILGGQLPARNTGAPVDLTKVTILLPTRRAARALQDAFLRAVDGRALLLPRIRPIAEGNEDLALLSGITGPDALTPGNADIPPAMPEITRRIVMTGLVQRWSRAMRAAAADADPTSPAALVASAGAGTAAQASALALELARLIDEVETEEVDLSRLPALVPDRFSAHWEKTLDFLRIVLEWWPLELAERRMLSPMDRRNRLVRAEAARLAAAPPDGPVIVAGVTGSIPATAELMRVVAHLEHGAIVIPGLDLTLDEPSWNAIAAARSTPADTASRSAAAPHPEHPQYALQRLLGSLAIPRDAVSVLDGALPPEPIRARNRLISEAMRPARTTGRWHHFTRQADRNEIEQATAGLSLIEAQTEEDEAEVVSLILREALETPDRTAALVTRDRLLARRVAIRLETWGIRVDDSAGRPLSKTMPGAFLDLLIEAAAEGFTPAATVALLKHPLTRLGRPAGEVRRTARAFEIAAFRTIYLGRGPEGLSAALDAAEIAVRDKTRRGAAVSRLRDEDWAAARALLADLTAAAAPLMDVLRRTTPLDLRTLLSAHISAAEAIAAQPPDDKSPGLWAEAAGEAASLVLAGLLDESLPALDVLPREYPDLYRSLIAHETVRPRIPLHPRLAIWGPLEARLMQPDVVVLGSLNDGTWPEQLDPGPWINRPMRAELGLPAPEERIGYATHDFSMLLGAPRVVMTRAVKVGGVPTVASRWLLRLRALLEATGSGKTVEPSEPWLQWARWRSIAAGHRPVKAPAPRPPLVLRPRKLSVSGVETWMANPYAIFAREILRLDPLPPLGQEPDAALRGGIVHGALAAFARQWPIELPGDIAAEIMRHARADLERLTGNPRIATFWLMRLERFATWFAGSEAGRRDGVERAVPEVDGKLVIAAPAGPFTLSARADRIDVRPDGIVITDYKTGASLAKLRKDAEGSFAPQLALEGAIALAGGFAGIATGRIAALRYISASGGEPAGATLDLRAPDLNQVSRDALQGLETLVALFDNPATPYAAVRRARFSYDYDDYAHLARTAEWSATGNSEEDDA